MTENGDRDGGAPSAAGPGRQPRLALRLERGQVVLLLVLTLAFLLPRVVAFWGLTYTNNLMFADMVYHQYHADLVAKLQTLPAEQLRDPFLIQNADLLERINLFRWPAGLYILCIPWFTLWGPMSIWAIQVPNLILTLLLLAGVGLLGRSLADGRTALWALVVTVLCPALVAASWYLSLDYALTGMVLVGLTLLHVSRGLSRIGYALAFAVWSALGLFTKGSYVIYLLAPSVVLVLRGLWRGPRLRVAAGLLLATSTTTALFALLHYPQFFRALSDSWIDLRTHTANYNLPAATIEPFTWRWLLSQPIFAAINFPFPLLILALPGLVLLHMRRRGGEARWVLLSFFWGSVAILTAMSNKLERYLQPVYPVLCLLAVWGIRQLVPERLRERASALVAVAFGGVLVLTQLHPTPWFISADPATPTYILWSEYRMPDLATLSTLRRQPEDFRCRLKPLVDQVEAWALKDPDGRLVVLACLSDPAVTHRNFPYSEFVLLVSQRLQDRIVLSGGLYGQEYLPGGVLQAPNLVALELGKTRLSDRYGEIHTVARRSYRVPCEHDDADDEPMAVRLVLINSNEPGKQFRPWERPPPNRRP